MKITVKGLDKTISYTLNVGMFQVKVGMGLIWHSLYTAHIFKGTYESCKYNDAWNVKIIRIVHTDGMIITTRYNKASETNTQNSHMSEKQVKALKYLIKQSGVLNSSIYFKRIAYLTH